MESSRIQNKLKLLFERMSAPGYVMDNYYADGFINKLSNNADPDAKNLTTMPQFPDLILEAFNDYEKYHTTVKAFLTRMLAIACQKEVHFAKIVCKKSYMLKELLSEVDSPNMNPSLRVACMEVAMALVSHASGTNWILETDLWKKILGVKTQSVTIFVVRLMYKFASDFLWKLNDLGDVAHISTVIEFIWKPIEELGLINEVALTVDERREDEICNIMEPILQILLSVLNRNERFHKTNLILDVLLKEFHLLNKLYILFDKMRRDHILMTILKLLYLLVILRVFQTKPSGPEVVYTSEDFVDMKILYFNSIQNLLQRHSIIQVLDYSYISYLIASSILKDLNIKPESEQCGRKTLFKYEVLFIILVPLFVYINYDTKQGKRIEDEKINEYLATLLNLACEHTARAAYRIRDLMGEGNTLPLIMHTVKKLTCLRGHLNDDQASFVFQVLFFVLRSYSPVVESSSQAIYNLEDSEQKVVVMTYVMDMILSLVKNHNITWHETLEVICLNTIVHDILSKRANLSCKFVVAAINVMTVTVRKFLPPNLSLLMEAQPGSAMHDIGKLIYLKMHDINWEVRDSALELLQVCTEIAYIKFPPIKKQIMENNLINVAATIAFNDYEPYVQVSAFRCVAAAIRVCSMWDVMKAEHPHLLVSAFRCVAAAIRVCSMWDVMKAEHPHLLVSIEVNLIMAAIAFNVFVSYMQISVFRCVTAAIRVSSMWDVMKAEHPHLLVSIEVNLIMAAIAFNDYEPYVQVSAFRCVAAAIRVCSMWDVMKAEHPHLLEDLVQVLRNSQEGIVRREVCNVLCEIYQNVKLAPSFKQILYEHMASIAMCDFHWEVQMSALKFWKITIQAHLTDQGMLDGKFPQVTFSKESRKIITLNTAEIQKILQKVLDELASIGCLTVLLKLIHDENEVEVMATALDIAQDLFAILQEYKVTEIVKSLDDNPKTIADLVCDVKEENHAGNDEEMEAETSTKAENVIEGILNVDDINLLADMYKTQMNLQNEKAPSPVTPKLKLFKTASPDMFINLMKSGNFKAVIQQRREWNEGIRSVSSLLDDVLGIYEVNEEANTLDCY